MAEGPRGTRRKQAKPRRKDELDQEEQQREVPELHSSSFTDGSHSPDTRQRAAPSAGQSLESAWTQGDAEKQGDTFRWTLGEHRDSEYGTEVAFLQQSNTAVIYPEAPEEREERTGPEPPCATPEDFSQLLVCPFCDRGYKRSTSLKEHIRLRHQQHGLSCSQCSEAFSRHEELDHHMTTHKPPALQSLTEASINRKFKCVECGKAFKYKHHLKEHLRIHSGEKPYECSKCGKRFSHSGSYSSHISSKKCVALNNFKENPKPDFSPICPSSPENPALTELCRSLDKEQLLESLGSLALLDIKSEPMDDVELLSSHHRSEGPRFLMSGPSGSPDHSPLTFLGFSGHRELHAVDRCMFRNPEEMDTLRSYMKDLQAHIEERRAEKMFDFTLQKVNEAKSLIQDSKKDRDRRYTGGEEYHLFHSSSCKYCGETFTGPIPLHQHQSYLCKRKEEIKAKSSPPLSTNTSSNHVSQLKAYFAMNTDPNSDELLKISIAVGLPQEFIREWFDQWKNQEIGTTDAPCADPSNLHSSDCKNTNAKQLVDQHQDQLEETTIPPCPPSESRGEVPLDLSLPKPTKTLRNNGLLTEYMVRVSDWTQTSEHANFIDMKVIGFEGQEISCQEKRSIFGNDQCVKAPVYCSLPHEGDFSPPVVLRPAQTPLPGLRAFSGLGPISFLPHMAYTCSTAAFTEIQPKRKYPQRPMFQGELLDRMDLMADTESLISRKRMKKTDSGMYACDLCDKTFQKSSSLLRHKYEHTGKRPHQCQICQKAFKHKHHLIEHSRLHSGEKPYQCDKCGKRFSHSGSYSQHMNHRYSYCKREAEERQTAQRESPEQGGEEGLTNTSTYLQRVDMLAPLHPKQQLKRSSGLEGTEEGEDSILQSIKQMDLQKPQVS